MTKKFSIAVLVILVCLMLAACGETPPTATPAVAAATQTPYIIVVTATPPPTTTSIPTPVPPSATAIPTATIAPTATVVPTATIAPTPKAIAVFGQGIGTSLNSNGEPQSPTSRYQEDAHVYFFLNFQDANPSELLTLSIKSLSNGSEIFNEQKPFVDSKGFVVFNVYTVTPDAYQAHFEARGKQVGSLFNFEVLPKPTVNVAATAAIIAAATAKVNSYASVAPTETFVSDRGVISVGCKLLYTDHVNDFDHANSNSKYIVITTGVSNYSSKSLYVSPTNFTLVSTSGVAVSLSSDTFSVSNYLQPTQVPSGSSTFGIIVFLVSKDFIPGRLIYNDYFNEVTTKIIQ